MQLPPLVTVVGGSGFLGRYIVRNLAKAGYRVRVLARHASDAAALKTAGDVGQIALQSADITRPESLKGALDGSFAVINAVGILYERGRQNFATVHAQAAERLAKMAKQAGVKRFIHISSLGVDRALPSNYARTKATGEKAVLAAFPEATILRPSVMFGPEDNFFNQFAAMSMVSPFLPLIGGGNTRFQPVYVADVAEAVMRSLEREDTRSRLFELGGPTVYSFKEILQYILARTGRCAVLLPVPFTFASLLGLVGEFMPTPPLTRDQVRLLRLDNVVTPAAKGFADLGMTPTAVEMIVPAYLARYARRDAANLPQPR